MIRGPGVTWNDAVVLSEVDRFEKIAITKSCLHLEREIKLAMKSTPRLFARKYKRQKKGRGVYHHPSAPGHPPAVDTARLINSMTHKFSWGMLGKEGQDDISKPVAGRHEKIGAVGTGMEKMKWLEFGTRTMQPRPVLRTTFEKSKPVILGFFK